MNPIRSFVNAACVFHILKPFAHDDFFEDDELCVFVRGNGFWLDSVKWLDASSIALAYKKYGELELNKVDGTFSIFINDKKKGDLIFVTDHLNFFPFYIKATEEKYQISDSLSIFREMALDQFAIKQLFSIGSIVGKRTLVKDIKKLPPASVTTIDSKGHLTETTYWKCEPVKTNATQFKSILESTIGLIPQLSSSPSLTLTAGLDSRMVFSELLKQKINFQTFTFGHKGAVDVTTAKTISRDFDIPHHSYRIDPSNKDFIENFENEIAETSSYCDGMIPFIKGVHANYCFKKEAETSDLIVTATGELVYSHYAEVPTLLPKDSSSLFSIAKFLTQFNADTNRPKEFNSLEDIEKELIEYFEEYNLDSNILYYDAFYLNKLTGLTSYLQQFLSSHVRLFNPIFTKKMIVHSMGLDQNLRDHRKLQREIIVTNNQKLNDYLVNGFKVVKPTFAKTLISKWNYGIRLFKKGTNRLLGKQFFTTGYIHYPSLLAETNVLKKAMKIKRLGSLPVPSEKSSESYLFNFLSLEYWLK